MEKPVRVMNPGARTLRHKGFVVYRGWNEKLAEELVECSKDPFIKQWTPNDAERRFTDVPTAMKWHDEGQRTVYSLYDNSDEGLTGVIWYDTRSRKDLDATHTFGIRMYNPERLERRKKLAHGFMKAAQYDFEQLASAPVVWLETDSDNVGARDLYENFGYETVSEANERITMIVRPTDRIARFYDDL